MSFKVRVKGDFAHAFLVANVPVGALAEDVAALVEASKSGDAVGFKMATCGIFLLDAMGSKHSLEPEAAFPAAPGSPAPPAPGSTVNVWIETPVAASAGAGSAEAEMADSAGGGMRALLAGMEERLTLTLQRATTPAITFSAASAAAADKVLRQLCILQSPALELPALEHLLPPEGALRPFMWERGQMETAASGELLSLLQHWVKSGSVPAITNAFMDVQGLAAHAPMEISAGTVGHFMGVSDMVILRHGIAEEDSVAPLSTCAASVDWKRPTSFGPKAIKAQAVLQAVGFSQLHGGSHSPPVFFTDMSTGFRCWRIVDGQLGVYHGAAGTALLSLEEGVALIRHFLVADQNADRVRVDRQAAVAEAVGWAVRDVAAGAAGAPSAVDEAAGAPPAGGSASGTTPPAGKARCGSAMEASSPDDPSALLSESSSPEEEVATLLSITHGLAAHWSRMGGFRLADFCDA